MTYCDSVQGVQSPDPHHSDVYVQRAGGNVTSWHFVPTFRLLSKEDYLNTTQNWLGLSSVRSLWFLPSFTQETNEENVHSHQF